MAAIKATKVNVAGINRLLASGAYTRRDLATMFDISMPTFRAYMKGFVPKRSVADYINRKIDALMGPKVETKSREIV